MGFPLAAESDAPMQMQMRHSWYSLREAMDVP